MSKTFRNQKHEFRHYRDKLNKIHEEWFKQPRRPRYG